MGGSWTIRLYPTSRSHRLLCRLGLHAWEGKTTTWPGPPQWGEYRQHCVVCGKRGRL